VALVSAVPAGRSLAGVCDRVTAGLSARLDEDDPRRVVAELARRLAETVDDDPANISAVRELRLAVSWLAENTSAPQADELEDFLASVSVPAFRNPGD
jgi:hypothetical protein